MVPVACAAQLIGATEFGGVGTEVVCTTYNMRHAASDTQDVQQVMVSKEFGDAGAEVVCEEFLEGEELSVRTD